MNISSIDEKLVDDSFNIDFSGIEFPVKLENIDEFIASNHDININVFGISAEDNKTIVGPLFSSARKSTYNINLLLLTDGERSHYCWIRDLSKLASRQKKSRRDRHFYCQICLLAFNSEEQLKKHEEHGCLGKNFICPFFDFLIIF